MLKWSLEKGITGPNGKGTPEKQVAKMLEEVEETVAAVKGYQLAVTNNESQDILDYWLEKVKDGIGDVIVTAVIEAEMFRWSAEECLQHSYNIISKRTGRMIAGTFVKSEDLDDDLDEPLGQACRLGDEVCESCQ